MSNANDRKRYDEDPHLRAGRRRRNREYLRQYNPSPRGVMAQMRKRIRAKEVRLYGTQGTD